MQIKFLQTKEYSKIFAESLKDIDCYRIMFAHRLKKVFREKLLFVFRARFKIKRI